MHCWAYCLLNRPKLIFNRRLMSNLTGSNSQEKYTLKNSSKADYGFSTKRQSSSKPFHDKTQNRTKHMSLSSPDISSRRPFAKKFHSHASSPRNTDLESRIFGSKSSGIDFTNYENIPVEMENCAQSIPMNSFSDLKLGEVLDLNVELCGYSNPTPIQRNAMPVLFSGRDIMACAQTGSGKTAAYLLPIVNRIYQTVNQPGYFKPIRYNSEPFALILAPTRELVQQIHLEAVKLTYRTGIRVVSCFGGASSSAQLQNIDRGVEIIISTPGRLNDFINRGYLSLENVSSLVLDEADRMLDMGFQPQIERIIETSKMPNKENRQTLLFSATYPPSIDNMTRKYLNNPVKVTIGKIGIASDTIKQVIEHVNQYDKKDRLLDILKDVSSNDHSARVLVFVSTKRSADEIEMLLFENKFKVVAIHGDRSQNERDDALSLFREGSANIMVATDVAQRGIDIPQLTHVINYDFPNDIDDYVHRIGRTGRVGRSGVAITFFNQSCQDQAFDLIQQLKTSKQEVPEFLLNMANFRSSSNLKMNYSRPKYRSSDSSLNDRGRSYFNNDRDKGNSYSKPNAYSGGPNRRNNQPDLDWDEL